MKVYRDADIEAASGKGAGDENFPVGSFLIAPPLRPHVKAYYDFARGADDIGDDPDLDGEEKIRRLEAYRQVLHGEAKGLTKPEALRRSLLATGVPLERGSDLLRAFKQDARQDRYASLSELITYCEYSACPVGQFLLDLHGEDRALFPASDALCTSLQILNHLQDCSDDLRKIGRSYLPIRWLTEEGAAVEDVLADRASPELRKVFHRLLDVCDDLNRKAEELVGGLRSRRLAAESAVILRLAKRLHNRLRTGDPVAERVALSRTDFLAAGALGLWQGALMPRRAA
ncbi:squalene/phytoene synthase family protein [Parvularcula lutaonensis]|uniref:Squalene/phytoene synthase family protein n=1 Tax=Parvularcula lutaonensis TaxID=491923 RepID=A0ABV7M952_9PROT|nr:squalene/phytoene synthase family protein [Parvularcula lutaonensis]GGY46228.1 squalene synthase HpnC [Parvularcula lutaonensis]